MKNQWTALREKKGWAPSELANSIGASTACNIAEPLDANVTEPVSTGGKASTTRRACGKTVVRQAVLGAEQSSSQ